MPFSDVVSRITRWFQGQGPSKVEAKHRLQLILIQDRADTDPRILDALRDDLLYLMGKYFEVADDGLDVEFQHEGDTIALVANIPIRAMKGRPQMGRRALVGEDEMTRDPIPAPGALPLDPEEPAAHDATAEDAAPSRSHASVE